MSIIKNFNVSTAEEALWVAAAYQWRLPYWDWGVEQPYAGNYAVPQFLTLKCVEIMQPGVSPQPPTIQISNPLYKFTNPMQCAMGDPKMGNFAIPDDDDYPVRAISSICGLSLQVLVVPMLDYQQMGSVQRCFSQRLRERHSERDKNQYCTSRTPVVPKQDTVVDRNPEGDCV